MRTIDTYMRMHVIILTINSASNITQSSCCDRSATRQHAPGIDFDKIQHHRVRPDWQLKRLLDIRSLALDAVATTDVSVLTTFCDFATVPALEIVGTIE